MSIQDLITKVRELAELADQATPPPWRACVWDPMERPHVTTEIPEGRDCTREYDLPKTATDAMLMAAARNEIPELLRQLADALEEACCER